MSPFVSSLEESTVWGKETEKMKIPKCFFVSVPQEGTESLRGDNNGQWNSNVKFREQWETVTYLTTRPSSSDIREQYSQWCLTDLLLLTCSFRQEIRPWGGTETLLGWGEGEVLQLDLRWGKLTGKKECQQIVVATSGHQVKAQNLTWRVIPEGHPPPKKSGQGCSLPTISDGLPFALPFFLNSVPSVHLNILSLLHVLFVFVMF